MSILLDGKEVALKSEANLKERVKALKDIKSFAYTCNYTGRRRSCFCYLCQDEGECL